MTTHRIRVTVNGIAREAEVEPRLLFVHFLRDVLRLTGTHIGCDTTLRGVHGALRWQTDQILYALRRPGRWAQRADGGRPGTKWTITPHPGRVLAGHGLVWLLHTGDAHDRLCPLAAQLRPAEEEIRWAISGNLCRCRICQHCQSGPVCGGEDTAGREAIMTLRTSPEVGGMGHAVKRKEDRVLSGDGARTWMISSCRACCILISFAAPTHMPPLRTSMPLRRWRCPVSWTSSPAPPSPSIICTGCRP